jgi:hypothetical protein
VDSQSPNVIARSIEPDLADSNVTADDNTISRTALRQSPPPSAERDESDAQAARKDFTALVVACRALFVALTGTSVAVVNALPKNSIGTAQLKSNAVVSSEVKDGSLHAADFAPGPSNAHSKWDTGRSCFPVRRRRSPP